MKIAVCIKKIPDPEIPPAKFRLDDQAMKVFPPEGIPPVINPYDAQAVELALRLKDSHGSHVTVLSLVEDDDSSVIRHALAMGADEGIALNDPAFFCSDSFAQAHILSKAVQKIASCDLIMCGRQAADWDEGLVGALLAEELGFPLVTLAFEVDLVSGQLLVKRTTMDGHQIFEMPVPAVITVGSGVGQPRLPSGWGIIAASQKKILTWDAAETGVDSSRTGEGASRRRLIKLYAPEKSRECRILSGETTAEAAALLAEELAKTGIIQYPPQEKTR